VEIGSIRSLIPTSVKVLALTAMAILDTLDCVICSLSLEDPSLIGLPPNRSNIKYSVKHHTNIEEFTKKIIDDLILKQVNLPKTIVFCQSLQNCATFFGIIKKRLDKNITEPPGVPYDEMMDFCLVDLFTAVLSTKIREALLKEFCKYNIRLRLLIATTAFGMGVDCPDIEIVTNWGCPNTIEELVQETG